MTRAVSSGPPPYLPLSDERENVSRNPYPLAKRVVIVAQTQQLPFLAAAIAYYAFLSLVPLLLVSLTLATIFASEAIANELVSAFDAYLSPEAATLIETTLLESRGRSGFTVLGLVTLSWGALRIFRGLDIAFSRAYGRQNTKSIFRQLRDVLVVLLGIVTAVAATIASIALLALAPIPYAGFVGTVLALVFLPVVFFPLYYIFPAENVTGREAIPGAIFAGVGWTVLGLGFGLYSAQADTFQLYGIMAGVILLLIWFYFGGMVLLSGAVLNAVLAGRFDEDDEPGGPSPDRQLQQEGGREHSQRATMTDADGPADDGDGNAKESVDPTNDGDANDSVEPTDVGSADDSGGPAEDGTADASSRAERVTREEIAELREQLDRFEDEIEDRTVHRTEVEGELKQYVRRRTRRGHAHGWGPYLVLLYGTLMTLGAFFFLSGGWAVLAMLVIWLSTLGLYTLMVIVGITLTASGVPRRLFHRLRNLR